jgi:hypothetical protein
MVMMSFILNDDDDDVYIDSGAESNNRYTT